MISRFQGVRVERELGRSQTLGIFLVSLIPKINDMVVITTPFNTTPDKIQQTINETIDLYKEMHLEVNTEKCECTHPTSLFICVDRAVYMTYDKIYNLQEFMNFSYFSRIYQQTKFRTTWEFQLTQSQTTVIYFISTTD
ncbi:Hypothetical_protein [Hexamita inflata]|uniref:Hypothetical_protein n=1 Tax=Hexamita inflata TaxID=28002 RepID=A0ABP1HK47_9EUKA